MKIAFNILPVITDYQHVHLLVEAGDYGISFAWFTKNPCNIWGLAVYNLVDKILPGTVADEIGNILRSAPIFNKSYASVHICYDFKESLLVPETYYNPASAGGMLNLVYAADEESNVKTDQLNGVAIANVYAVDKKIESVLAGRFPVSTVHHASSLQIPVMHFEKKGMQCIFFHNSIKVFLFDGPSLQIVQQFGYSSPVDAAYHLLNCCQQYDIRPEEVNLVLSGMIDENSRLYDELYKYFLNISFEGIAEGIELHERILYYPPHFFSHLSRLASCVS